MNLRIAISGAGFLADAYDLFVINVAVDLMSRCDYHQALTPDMKGTIKSMALAGAVVGQLGFGAIADLIGRRKVFIITCALVLLGALMSAVVTDTSAGIYSQLCFWRFILGVGVGGEYPLSASITSESSEDGNRAKNLATVFSMQGIGTVLCSVVLVILTNSDISYDAQWRIALGLGGLPMALAFYFRWKMHETTWREESQAFQNKEQLRAISETNNNIVEESSLNKVMSYFSNGFSYIRRIVWNNRISLLGTAGAWFILDIVFYANGLFSGQVTKAMGIASSPRQESFAALILQLLALPGYFCTIFYVSSIGLLRLQLIGFAMTAIIFFLLAGLQPYLVKIPVLYVFLYGFTFFFQNFGANATTYIIPSIIYSSAERATCHGISSAAGKLGALLGAQVFLFVVDAFCHNGNCDKSSTTKQVNSGLQLTFFVCGVLAVIGWIWSYFLVGDIPAVSLLENQTRTNLKDDEDEESSVHLYEMVALQASSHGLLPPVSEESGLGSRNSTKAQGNRFLPNFSFFSLSSAVTTSEELNRQDKDYYLVKVIDDEEVTVNDRESLSTNEIGSRLTDVSASLLKEPQIDEGEVNNPLFPNRSTTSSNADILLLPEGKKKEKGSKDKGKKETKEKDKDKKKKKQKNKDRQDYDDDIAL